MGRLPFLNRAIPARPGAPEGKPGVPVLMMGHPRAAGSASASGQRQHGLPRVRRGRAASGRADGAGQQAAVAGGLGPSVA